MKKLVLFAAAIMMAQLLPAQLLADLFETNKHSVVTIDQEEMLLGGDIILQVDDIVITGDESVSRLFDYLDSVESVSTHKIKVLRAGEIMQFNWVSTGF